METISIVSFAVHHDSCMTRDLILREQPNRDMTAGRRTNRARAYVRLVYVRLESLKKRNHASSAIFNL
jgi:hypothetical protein